MSTQATPTPSPVQLVTHESLAQAVSDVVSSMPVVDMHTHLFPAQLADLNCWGIDEILTYHYLIAEFFRSTTIAENEFYKLPKAAQADAVWETLFVRNTPLSEATRGVVTIFHALGLDPSAPDLTEARSFFAGLDPEEHLQNVLESAGVKQIVMTNDPFDAKERAHWESGAFKDSRFRPALRIDTLLLNFKGAAPSLRAWGFHLSEQLTDSTIKEVRRFLKFWVEKMQPAYMAVSLPPEFTYPDKTSTAVNLLINAALPICSEYNLPLSLMIGVRRQVNPQLRLAGDSVGCGGVDNLERLCADFPSNRFLVTMLARENQHSLCVAARKFRNLMPFGCWWFLNTMSMVREITTMRLELLGPSFIAQHSDARVLEQLLYKWPHSRTAIADALTNSYLNLTKLGTVLPREQIERDVYRLLEGNFAEWSK